MPDTVPAELRTEIVETLRSAGAGFAVLHGSRVTGVPRVDSDLDVAAWWPADAPAVALRIRRTPLLVDEWQLVPEVLGAIKRAVDDEPGSRRFVITGSSQADLTAAGWPATGRVIRVPMWGLSQRELLGNPRDPLSDRPDRRRRGARAG